MKLKKLICVLLSLLIAAGAFAVLPVTAYAAEVTGEAVISDPQMPGGTTGDACEWSFNTITGTLTVSGSGDTGNYGVVLIPWNEYVNDIKEIVVTQGVTSIGENCFEQLPNLKKVSLAPSVTQIKDYAFIRCGELTSLTIGDNVTSIGRKAFADTGLRGITIKNKHCSLGEYSVGYFEGKNNMMRRVSNFVIYGYQGSTAQTYANNNGFTFVDLDAEEFEVEVEYGSAYNAVTGEKVTAARAGERIRAVADQMPDFAIFNYFFSYNIGVEFDENGYFTMPAEYTYVRTYTRAATPLRYDLSEGYLSISNAEYEYLVDCIVNGRMSGGEHPSKKGEFYIYLCDDTEVYLKPDSLSVFDYDYAPSYCINVGNNREKNPVYFIFAENEVYGGTLDLTLPMSGDAWDFFTMNAALTTKNTGFTIANAYWYDEGGLSAFDKFEGGKQYFVSFDIVPDEGYFLTHNSDFEICVGGEYACMAKFIYDNGDGSFKYSSYPKRFRIKGTQPHSVTVNNGFATYDHTDIYGENAITQAVAGDKIYALKDLNSLEDNEYYIIASKGGVSEQVSLDVEGTPFFYMPDEDVTVTMTYVKDTQSNVTLKLYDGSFTVTDTGSEEYSGTDGEAMGTRSVLDTKADNWEYLDPGEIRYDIDGDTRWDILRSGDTYSLLPTSSLTKNVTLSLSREESYLTPVRNVTIEVVKPENHKIIVNGGVASSKHNDFANDFVITEAAEGDTVYVVPRASEVGDDSYIAQFSMEATSDDVDIIDEAGISFVMPDHDVTVDFSCDILPQMNSVLDFSKSNPVTVTVPEGTPGVRGEAYGIYMVLWLSSASYYYENNGDFSKLVYYFDVDGDGNDDIMLESDNNTYHLLPNHSLDTFTGEYDITLSREISYTVPVRSLKIITKFVPKRGDVNGDNDVDVLDAVLVQKYAVEKTELTPEQLERANVNNDNVVDVLDASMIQKYAAGKITEFE